MSITNTMNEMTTHIPFEEEEETTLYFNLSPELKSTIDGLILDWIRLHYEELEEELKTIGFHTTEHANTYLIDELFHQRDRWCFGKYLKNSNQITRQHINQIIQCCSVWYEEVETNNFEYTCFHFGKIYVDDYTNLDILQMVEDMKCTICLK
jgi:hypothetical protein